MRTKFTAAHSCVQLSGKACQMQQSLQLRCVCCACFSIIHTVDVAKHSGCICVSKHSFIAFMQGTGKLQSVKVEDWTQPTIDSWRHSIWVGVCDPWIVVFKGPVVWYRTMREIVTLERMHRAFDRGLMQYGMMKAVKSDSDVPKQSVAQGQLKQKIPV